MRIPRGRKNLDLSIIFADLFLHLLRSFFSPHLVRSVFYFLFQRTTYTPSLQTHGAGWWRAAYRIKCFALLYHIHLLYNKIRRRNRVVNY